MMELKHSLDLISFVFLFICCVVVCVFTATRAKMTMMNSMSRMRGQEKGPGYTQTEAMLGESMQRFGRELGEESTFGEFDT